MPILGAEELQQSFKDLSANLKKRVIRNALKTAINIIAEEIVPHTPEHLGLLKASAETRVTVNASGTTGKATFGYGDQNRIALLVEYGHADIGHEPDKKQLGAVAPAPWILPGLDRSLPAALTAFDEAVELSVINYER